MTGDKRQEKLDSRHETVYVRQEACDRKREKEDMRQEWGDRETGDMRCKTWRQGDGRHEM